jgi:hypothetical protein
MMMTGRRRMSRFPGCHSHHDPPSPLGVDRGSDSTPWHPSSRQRVRSLALAGPGSGPGELEIQKLRKWARGCTLQVALMISAITDNGDCGPGAEFRVK